MTQEPNDEDESNESACLLLQNVYSDGRFLNSTVVWDCVSKDRRNI